MTVTLSETKKAKVVGPVALCSLQIHVTYPAIHSPSLHKHIGFTSKLKFILSYRHALNLLSVSSNRVGNPQNKICSVSVNPHPKLYTNWCWFCCEVNGEKSVDLMRIYRKKMLWILFCRQPATDPPPVNVILKCFPRFSENPLMPRTASKQK